MPLKYSHANEIDKVVGANLRLFRTGKRMSQASLAELVGVSFQQIQKYEKGSNRIGASTLWEFCEIFNIKPSHFYDGLTSNNTPDLKPAIDRAAFFEHPRAIMLLDAFMEIQNSDFELGVISLCRSLKKRD